MTRTTTADVTGMVVIVAVNLVTRFSSIIARPASVWTRINCRILKRIVPEPVQLKDGKVMVAATMGTTTVAVTGTAVIAAAKVATSSSLLTAQNVNAKIPRKRKNARRIKHVVNPHSTETGVATMPTTTAAATGTMVIAVGKTTTYISFRTAQNAGV